MIETKHTPGPWSVEDPMGDEPNDDLWVVVGDESFNWRTVALVSCDFEKGPEPKPIYSPQRDANARLIAASPNMLKALQRVYHEWDGEPEDMIHVRDAIKEATGQ